jgi:hypothetical protein
MRWVTCTCWQTHSMQRRHAAAALLPTPAACINSKALAASLGCPQLPACLVLTMLMLCISAPPGHPCCAQRAHPEGGTCTAAGAGPGGAGGSTGEGVGRVDL